MRSQSAARRYARAVIDLARSDDDVERWRREIALAAVVLADPSVTAFLASPAVAFEQKKALIDERLSTCSQEGRNLASLVVRNGRTAEFPEIARQFEALARSRQGVTVAEVTTARPISEAESARVSQKLGAITGLRVIVERKVDPDLLGGFIARFDEREIDGSIRRRLADLRARITQ